MLLKVLLIFQVVSAKKPYSRVPYNNAYSIENVAPLNGYLLEQYSITTEDGYISQMFRIPGKKSEEGKLIQKPVVLMVHGLMCNMNFWIANEVQLAPPFILVEQGFDVWLGNNRGNRYATNHTTLNTSEKEFW